MAGVAGTVSDGDKGGKREPEQTGRYGSLPRRREGRGAVRWRERPTRQELLWGLDSQAQAESCSGGKMQTAPYMFSFEKLVFILS